MSCLVSVPSVVRLQSFVGLASLGVLVACGGGAPEAQSPTTPEPAPQVHAAPTPKKSGMNVQTELGEIDKAATEKTFDGAAGALRDCYRKGQKRVDYLGGDLQFFLRIGQDGRVRYGYLEDSTLGDRDTEKCMLDALGATSWPKPQGGEAEVRKKVGFDPGDVRPPAEWGPEKITAALTKGGAAAEKCREGAAGKYHVTLYVEPDGKDGRVQAAGVAPPSKEGEGKVDCLVGAFKGLKVPSPGSYAAKVSFSF